MYWGMETAAMTAASTVTTSHLSQELGLEFEENNDKTICLNILRGELLPLKPNI
jgi:hypothetical protein